jgi:hypothetical protein
LEALHLGRLLRGLWCSGADFQQCFYFLQGNCVSAIQSTKVCGPCNS